MAEIGKGDKYTVYFTNKEEKVSDNIIRVKINQSDDKTFYAFSFDSKNDAPKGTEGNAKNEVEVSNEDMPCIIFSMSGAEEILKNLEIESKDKEFKFKVFYQFGAYIIAATKNYNKHIRAIFQAIEQNASNNKDYALQEISVATSLKDVSIVSLAAGGVWKPHNYKENFIKPEIKDDFETLLFTCQLRNDTQLNSELNKIPFFMPQQCFDKYEFESAKIYTIPLRVISRPLLLDVLRNLEINSKDVTKAYVFNAFNFNYVVVPNIKHKLTNFSAPSIKEIKFDKEESRKDLSDCRNLGKNKFLASIEFTHGKYIAYVQSSYLK